jgi:hydrogenase 3 maturation protease
MENMETSRLYWLDLLRRILERLRKRSTRPRLAVLGIGNELRGDDGIGPLVLRALQIRLAGHDRLFLADAGPAPENFTGALRRFAPHLVLFIDAAVLNEAPGSIRWIDPGETDGFSASSHTLPPSILIEYLAAELGCEIFLIGVQPQDSSFGAPLSKPVERARDILVEALGEELGSLAG